MVVAPNASSGVCCMTDTVPAAAAFSSPVEVPLLLGRCAAPQAMCVSTRVHCLTHIGCLLFVSCLVVHPALLAPLQSPHCLPSHQMRSRMARSLSYEHLQWQQLTARVQDRPQPAFRMGQYLDYECLRWQVPADQSHSQLLNSISRSVAHGAPAAGCSRRRTLYRETARMVLCLLWGCRQVAACLGVYHLLRQVGKEVAVCVVCLPVCF